MSFEHHGERQPMNPELRKLFEDKRDQLLDRFESERRGEAQRQFPNGRLSGDDDGQLTFKIGADREKNVVAIEYSTPTVWMAMSPQQAVELAQILIKHARSIATEPITMVIH